MIESPTMKTEQPHSPLKKFLLIFCLLLLAQAQSFGQDKTSSAKLPNLLEQSGYTYSKVSDNIWTIPFHGKALPDFKVMISTGESIAVMFVVVAEKKQLRVTPELMRSLLLMNDDFDRVKIGIDKSGDLVVRVDSTVRIMDLEELKTNIEQVAAAADEITKAIKPYTIQSK